MKAFLSLAVASGLVLSAPVDAVPYFFDMTGDYTASWTLDSSPTPTFSFTNSFQIWDVPGFPDALFGIVDLTFWTSAAGGGISIDDIFGRVRLVDSFGSQLFTGPVAAPTFTLGTYDLTDRDGRTYTLVISEGVIPELATWGMMIAGFGLVGAALRRRKTAIA